MSPQPSSKVKPLGSALDTPTATSCRMPENTSASAGRKFSKRSIHSANSKTPPSCSEPSMRGPCVTA